MDQHNTKHGLVTGILVIPTTTTEQLTKTLHFMVFFLLVLYISLIRFHLFDHLINLDKALLVKDLIWDLSKAIILLVLLLNSLLLLLCCNKRYSKVDDLAYIVLIPTFLFSVSICFLYLALPLPP